MLADSSYPATNAQQRTSAYAPEITPIASPVNLVHGACAIVIDTRLTLERHAAFNRDDHVNETSEFRILLFSPAGKWDTRVHKLLSEQDPNPTSDPQIKETTICAVHRSRSRCEHICILYDPNQDGVSRGGENCTAAPRNIHHKPRRHLNQSHRLGLGELRDIFADDLFMAGKHLENRFLSYKQRLRRRLQHKEMSFGMASSQALGEINSVSPLQ